MLTPETKGISSAQQPGIERNTAMSSFPAFLHGIGRHNAKKIKAIQLPIIRFLSSFYRQLFKEIIRQHIPDLAHLVIDWDAARCYRDVWHLPAESPAHRSMHLSAVIVFVQLEMLSDDLPSLKWLTFVEGLSEFDDMGGIVLCKKHRTVENYSTVWTSIVERSRESRRNLGRPCVCRYRKCDV